MTKVFISRKLAEYSPFRNLDNISIIGKSLIEITPLEFELPQTDWVFFYSKNGVESFFKKPGVVLIPYKWGALSSGTAGELKKYVQDIEFVGNTDLEISIADQFQKVLGEHESCCFIRAKNSKDSVLKEMENTNCFSTPTYNNTPVNESFIEKFDILIFTSSLNAKAYFAKNEYAGQPVIAIGKPTEKTLRNIGVEKIYIAENPTEESMVDILKELIKS